MDALIYKRQPPGGCKTLSQEIKAPRKSQMKDGLTERIPQGNLQQKYEYKRTSSRSFPTFHPPSPL